MNRQACATRLTIGNLKLSIVNCPSRRRGFTLVEMLVVIAITAVLMAIMFVPLSRALDMSARANASIQGQDSVRNAMRRIVKDLSIATEVYEPRDLSLWGYNSWTFARNRARPASGAVPEKYRVRGGVIAMRLPRMQYYDTRNNHFITPTDVDPSGSTGLSYDAIALASCPRHGGAPVELRPVANGEPDSRITAYFLGLKNPGLQVGGAPVYDNLLLFKATYIPNNNTLNTYCLYRVEFDPLDPRFANWNLPSGLPNPDFFYDPTVVTIGGTSKPRYQWWKDATVTIMDAETSDAVKWLETNGKFMPHALCNWTPSPVSDEVAKPNRESHQYLLGGVGPADLPAVEFMLEHGHWTGEIQSDGKSPIPSALTISPAASNGIKSGPHIRVLQGGATLFDSAGGTRGRMIGFDSVAGKVTTTFARVDQSQPVGSVLQQYYTADPDPVTYAIDLLQDQASTTPAIPLQFGDVKTAFSSCFIVPGSEVVQKFDTVTNTFANPMRRVGWSGLSAITGRTNPYPDNDAVPQDQNEYSIDYVNGTIVVSPNEDWTRYKPYVRYRFQTTQRDDVVRVSYETKELANVNLGVVQYTRRRQETLPFEVAERVVIRNLK